MITIENDKEVVKINIFLLISFQDKEKKKDNIWKNSQRKSYKKSLNVLFPPPPSFISPPYLASPSHLASPRVWDDLLGLGWREP